MTDAIIVAIIAGVPGTLAALLGVFNRAKLGQVSAQVDGRLTELLELTKKTSKSEGAKEQRGTAEPL
jgi:hypothetical protein